jgi:hypothetical protein
MMTSEPQFPQPISNLIEPVVISAIATDQIQNPVLRSVASRLDEMNELNASVKRPRSFYNNGSPHSAACSTTAGW